MKSSLAFLQRLSGLTPNFGISQSIFTRGLGLIYFIAIYSWWTQIGGLVGSLGITPAANFIEALKTEYGAAAIWKAPSLFVITGASDAILNVVCVTGLALSVLVIGGLLQGPLLLGLWIIYLSLATTGGVFMGFQWDALLLEAGLLAVLFAPWKIWSGPRRISPRVPRLATGLLWLLIFKLMFLSGFVKLASLDETWWNLSALTFHYETQPIPHTGGWFAHQLPLWLQKTCVGLTYFIELALPFLIFLGRWPRRIAFFGFIGLMIAISATGNYTYFNLLTILLCIPLLDDSMWPKFVRGRLFKEAGEAPEQTPKSRWTWFGVRAAVGIPVLAISVGILTTDIWKGTMRIVKDDVAAGGQSWNPPLSQFRSCNSYGLFRVMTPYRPEIVVEGSYDGRKWFEYQWRWKPDNLDESPPFVAPHQPRLDWQMWFAALVGFDKENPDRQRPRHVYPAWFHYFMQKLLEGEPEVQQLLAHNPFPDQPPNYIRATLYIYEFTSPAERRKTGNWWKRELVDLYYPANSLKPIPQMTY
ncbi:MAG: hypothetical protein ACI8UO_001026 [Verrucomicrobiales bacterium]